jgi:hypothetical protein
MRQLAGTLCFADIPTLIEDVPLYRWADAAPLAVALNPAG